MICLTIYSLYEQSEIHSKKPGPLINILTNPQPRPLKPTSPTPTHPTQKRSIHPATTQRSPSQPVRHCHPQTATFPLKTIQCWSQTHPQSRLLTHQQFPLAQQRTRNDGVHPQPQIQKNRTQNHHWTQRHRRLWTRRKSRHRINAL